MKRKKTTIAVLIAVFLGLILFNIQPDIPVEELMAKYTNEASEFIEINGMAVHYRDEGHGHPLVLIHGTAASLHTWDGWTKELKDHFSIIRMDLPAFGLTGPHPERNYSLNNYTNFLKTFLDSIGVDSFYLAGNSLGGNISWNFSATYPEKVQKLILLDASGYPTEEGSSWIFTLARTPVLNQLLKKVTPRSVISNNLRQVYFNDEKISEELITRYHEMALRTGNRQAFIDRAKTIYIDLTEKIKTIDTPTLILWGAKDTWIPVSHADKFKADLPISEMVILENSGHVPMEENPVRNGQDSHGISSVSTRQKRIII